MDFRTTLEGRALTLHGLVIDGTAEDGTFQGDATRGPWVVFDIEAQKNISPEFRFRWKAKLALRRLVAERATPR